MVGGGRVGAPGVALQERDPGRAGGDGGAGDPGLVLALVGEQRPVVDVPDRVQPVAARHPEAVVDGQPRAGFQSDGVETEVVGARSAAGGEEDLVGLQTVAGVGEGHHGPVLAGHRRHRRTGADAHARRDERLGDQFTGEGLHAGQQALATDEDGDLGAEGPPGGGHLHGDDTAADDDQPAGDRLRAGGLTAGPGFDLRESRQVGQEGATAGGDHHRVPGGEDVAPAVRGVHDHAAGPGQARVTAVEARPDALQPAGLAVVLPMGGLVVAVGEDLGGVQRAVDQVAQAGYAARVGTGDRRAQQGLAGHARPVRALAADQFALHDRSGQAGRTGAVGDVLPHGSGT